MCSFKYSFTLSILIRSTLYVPIFPRKYTFT